MTTSHRSPARRIAKHLSRNAVAWLALFVALSGTSYAVTMISGTQVKDGSLTAKDLAKGVTSAPAATLNVAAETSPPPYAETTAPSGTPSFTFKTTRPGKVLLLAARSNPSMAFQQVGDESIAGVTGLYVDKKPLPGSAGQMIFMIMGMSETPLRGNVVPLAAGTHTIEIRYKLTRGAVGSTLGNINALTIVELG